MVQGKTTFVNFVLLNLDILATGGTIENATTTALCLVLEGISREELLKKRGNARAEAIDFHAAAVATAGDPNLVATLKPLRSPGSFLYYYCGSCGTPLKAGKCRCKRMVPNRTEFRQNRGAPTMPYRAYAHITHKNRYVFSTKPKLVETKRKPRGEITVYW